MKLIDELLVIMKTNRKNICRSSIVFFNKSIVFFNKYIVPFNKYIMPFNKGEQRVNRRFRVV